VDLNRLLTHDAKKWGTLSVRLFTPETYSCRLVSALNVSQEAKTSHQHQRGRPE
jgi:hypothetical protein